MMKKKTAIIDKIREYIATCPYLRDGKIGVDYLGNDPTTYSIEPVPVKPIVNKNIDGSCLEQYAFVLASRESYGAETIQNMLNSKFYEKFSKWIKQNNKDGILPEIEGIETIECTSTAYAYQTGIESARYQIQLRIEYYTD